MTRELFLNSREDCMEWFFQIFWVEGSLFLDIPRGSCFIALLSPYLHLWICHNFLDQKTNWPPPFLKLFSAVSLLVERDIAVAGMHIGTFTRVENSGGRNGTIFQKIMGRASMLYFLLYFITFLQKSFFLFAGEGFIPRYPFISPAPWVHLRSMHFQHVAPATIKLLCWTQAL